MVAGAYIMGFYGGNDIYVDIYMSHVICAKMGCESVSRKWQGIFLEGGILYKVGPYQL